MSGKLEPTGSWCIALISLVYRYIQCWLETTNTKPDSEDGDDMESAPTQTETTETTDDEDIFRVDLDDISSANVSHSKSFPRIRFANSSDGDDESDESDTESLDDYALMRQPFGARHKSKSPKMRQSRLYQQRTLYIQMEVSCVHFRN